ncbi:MAG: alpha/beta fold hydrolase [Candidatus Promineifilaceae bacterium]|nr:alpha/beta fold hydrolase [Candidatus Promineifilaceae bacterium]
MNEDVWIPARDGYKLAGTCFQPGAHANGVVILINAATAVPRGFYAAFAQYCCAQGYIVVTYDYRGIGGSRPYSLRGFEVRARDWALLDMASVLDWVSDTFEPRQLFLVGHSFGGQTAGLLPNSKWVAGMVTLSSQSGYWRMQGGAQKAAVAFHVNITFPVLVKLFGFLPWSKFGSAEDLPKGVALEWAGWCRRPGYLMDDETLPLERYQEFQAPVLAYSIDDDDWGSARSVDAMMSAYPILERRHVVPETYGLKSIGHFGFFRSKSEKLWVEVLAWFDGLRRDEGSNMIQSGVGK